MGAQMTAIHNGTAALRALPVRVRRWHEETPESYVARLSAANRITYEDLWIIVRRADPHRSPRPTQKHAEEALARLSGLPARPGWARGQGHQASLSVICRRCAHGEHIEVNVCVGPVCVRHRRWHAGGMDIDVSGRTGILRSQKILNGRLALRNISYGGPEGITARELLTQWRMTQPQQVSTTSEVDDFPLIVQLIQRLTDTPMTALLSRTGAGYRGQAAAIETVFTSLLGDRSDRVQKVELRGREVLVDNVAFGAMAQAFPINEFAETLVSRMPTIRARLLRHRNTQRGARESLRVRSS